MHCYKHYNIIKYSVFRYGFLHYSFLVQLMKDGQIVGNGVTCPNMEKVHGHDLVEGWISVEIKELFCKELPCWVDYPTLSEEIEIGSYSAWPIDQLIGEQYYRGTTI